MSQATTLVPEDLQLSAYDYDLPDGLIARYPLPQRDQSRMLVLDRQTGGLAHHRFCDLPQFLSPGDLVIINNTQVLPARLRGHRQGFTGKVELLLLHPTPEDELCWNALMKPTRKLPPGTVIEFPGTTATASVVCVEHGTHGQVRFQLNGLSSVAEVMNAIGEMPIPPYLNRPAEEQDKETYQTVFSKVPGAQAAPTAGLHFTPEVLQTLHDQGIQVQEVTLAVSSGTFRSVNTDDITQHVMDPEHYSLSKETAEAIQETKARGGKVVAIGTTVAKTLETVAAKYQGQVQADTDWSRLFIYPGFQFQVVDMLLTNFHLPKTTLLMLISALANREQILTAYREAVQEQYRFFSYGDCMLIR